MTFSDLIGLSEVILLAATLLATVGVGAYVAWQTARHFQLQHAKEFIARFNSEDMVSIRRRVDTYLTSNRSAAELIAAEEADPYGEAAREIDAIRTFVNFFQELGVAYKHRTVHGVYTWDLFGALIQKYWKLLHPFVVEVRQRRNRMTVFQDFEALAATMRKQDQRRGVVTPSVEVATDSAPGATPAASDDRVFVFGYGSLFNPDSTGRTLGYKPQASDLQVAWLAGYRRAWTVWDHVMMEHGADEVGPRPMAFLNVEPDVGARCNGVVFAVKPDQLPSFDKRERHYKRVDVTELITPRPSRPVVTYVGMEPWTQLPDETVVSARYELTVDEGLSVWGAAVRSDFEASTRPHDLPRVEGAYTFANA